MRCYKCDYRGEAACDHARYSMERGEAVCTHPCVLMADTQLAEAKQKLWEAESKLEQYRKAIQPIVKNCRDIIDAVNKEEKEGNE